MRKHVNKKNKLSRLSIDLPVEIQKKLKVLAAMQGKSMRAIVIESIEEQIKKLEALANKNFKLS